MAEAVDVVRRAFRPDGVNVGLNLGRASGGSVPSHVHVHVVPRWTGDTNFMASVANTQTIPESLDVSARKVRTAWVGVAAGTAVDTSRSEPDGTTGRSS